MQAKQRIRERINKRNKPTATNNAKDPLNVLPELHTKEARAIYIQENAIQREAPMPEGVAMDSNCAPQYRVDFSNANQYLLSYYIASSSFIGYYACAVIGQHWLVSKGCAMKARDAVKKWYKLGVNDGTDLDAKQIKDIEALDKKYKLRKNMIEAPKFSNIFGVRHVLFKHKDPNFDYSKPFNPDAFKNGKYAGMAQIDPYWVTPVLDNNDLTDPSAIGFYDPTYWQIQGKKYHKSHFVVLKGDEVADYLKPTYNYGGVPLTQKIYERVYAAERTANEAPQLIQTKRLNVRKTDLVKAQANKQQFVKNLQTANEYRDNYGVTVIGKDEEIQQIDTALTDLDANIMTQYQLVCGELGVPATKLLGTSPKGFSTGESDIDMYLEDVEELQGNDLTDIAMAHYARLFPSEGMAIDNIDIHWNPLKVMSNKELADANYVKAQTDAMLYNAGAIDNYDVRQRVINDIDSGYSGLDMPEDAYSEEEED